jgi:hypothetical protein
MAHLKRTIRELSTADGNRWGFGNDHRRDGRDGSEGSRLAHSQGTTKEADKGFRE